MDSIAIALISSISGVLGGGGLVGVLLNYKLKSRQSTLTEIQATINFLKEDHQRLHLENIELRKRVELLEMRNHELKKQIEK